MKIHKNNLLSFILIAAFFLMAVYFIPEAAKSIPKSPASETAQQQDKFIKESEQFISNIYLPKQAQNITYIDTHWYSFTLNGDCFLYHRSVNDSVSVTPYNHC